MLIILSAALHSKLEALGGLDNIKDHTHAQKRRQVRPGTQQDNVLASWARFVLEGIGANTK